MHNSVQRSLLFGVIVIGIVSLMLSCRNVTTSYTSSLVEIEELLTGYQDIEYDIVLIAGQSNAYGIGFGDGEQYIENDRISMLKEDYSISLANERIIEDVSYNNFGLFFAQEYVENDLLEEGRQLLLVNVAVGGTGFADHRWGLEEDLYEQMILISKALLNLNSNNRIITVLWHQGETDAILNSTYREYYANLHTLVTNIRCELSLSDVPFLAGDFVPAWKAEAKEQYPIDEIISAARQVMMDLPNCGFVESTGLSSNEGDTIHFSRSSNLELGIRYFEAYNDLR